MRKIFTSAVAAMFALGVSAGDVVTKLDKNKVIYMTNDTITSAMIWEEDPDTGEEIEVMGGKFWTGAMCIDAFNQCGMPLKGTSSTQFQFKFNTRKNYVDPATGFTMDAGAYRGIFVDGTIELQGQLGGDTIKGYTNCKGVVLYFMPIPNTWEKEGISVEDYPTGRVQAKYFKEVGGAWTQTSGQIYREIHIDMTPGANDNEDQVFKNTNILNFQRSEENPLEITVDQPYKLTVWLDNDVDPSTLMDLKMPNRKTELDPTGLFDEFANLVIEPGSTEAEMKYYFAKKGTACPYTSLDPNDHGTRGNYDSDAATGFDCMTNSWGVRDEWDANTAVFIGVKKRMYLVGMALLSATPNAESEFMNAADKLKAKWAPEGKAYCAHPAPESDGIQSVDASSAKNSNVAYNLVGQRVNANTKGIIIMNGKKIVK